MKTDTLGDPHIRKKRYTRFMVHYIDPNRLVSVLEEKSIPFFAMEQKVNMERWIFHIPDEFRRLFDQIIIEMELNVSPMHYDFWYQDRDEEAAVNGMRSIRARRSLFLIVTIMVLFLLLG